jgi:hypothetical protein
MVRRGRRFESVRGLAEKSCKWGIWCCLLWRDFDGVLGLRIGEKQFVARPGDVAVVAQGTPHRFWYAGEGEARFLCEIRPALQFESLIETMFTLAADGKTNRKGLPKPLRLAVIARAHFDTVRLPFPPAFLQRAALAVGAPIGKLLRYPTQVTRQRPLAASSC